MQFMQVCYRGDKAWHSMAWHDKENMKIAVHTWLITACHLTFVDATSQRRYLGGTWWSQHILNKVIAMRALLPARLA